jgi:hypothetical protein
MFASTYGHGVMLWPTSVLDHAKRQAIFHQTITLYLAGLPPLS